VAAVNALNDVYAMGGKPLLALNVVCFPECEDMAILNAILAGGLSKIKEAGALLVGGHSVDDLEPKYGLAVTGLIHPGRIISNSGARPGDRLYLSKPLGNGVITTALKAEMAEPQHIEEAVALMTTLNKTAAEVMQQCGLKAATDITGFGFLGHLYEMAQASDVEVEVYAPMIPFMSGALAYAGLGLIPAGAYNNRAYLENKIRYPSSIDPDRRELMLCPETAGGLLMAVSAEQEERFLQEMARRQVQVYLVGRVTAEKFAPIKITDKTGA
jgi:selenide,water dikinase